MCSFLDRWFLAEPAVALVPLAHFLSSWVALGRSEIPPSKPHFCLRLVFSSLAFLWKVGILAPAFEMMVGTGRIPSCLCTTDLLGSLGEPKNSLSEDCFYYYLFKCYYL